MSKIQRVGSVMSCDDDAANTSKRGKLQPQTISSRTDKKPPSESTTNSSSKGRYNEFLQDDGKVLLQRHFMLDFVEKGKVSTTPLISSTTHREVKQNTLCDTPLYPLERVLTSKKESRKATREVCDVDQLDETLGSGGPKGKKKKRLEKV